MTGFIHYNDISVHYSDVGKGNTILLLHGFLEDISMWNNLQEELKSTNRIICIDLLGHGKTDSLGEIHHVEIMAEVIKFVLDELKIKSVTIIGHSMGGYVALAFAELFPNVINGLCLMNSTSQEDSEERKENRLRAIRMAKTNYQALVSMSVSNLFSREKRSEILSEIETCKKTALQTSAEAYIACTKGMRIRKDRQHVLKSGKFKKLIIAGKQDPVLAYDNMVKEAEKTNTPLVTLPYGHMSHIENYDELQQTIKTFISQ